MAIAKEYKTLIAWRSFATNVRLLEKKTEETPAKYRLKVSPVDRHDMGAGQIDQECYFISFMGNPYTVTNVTETFIDVRDDFEVGTAPTASKIGIVYKSVDNAPFIAPTFYRYLHKTAADNMRKIEFAIIWQYATLLNNSWNPKGVIFKFDPVTGYLTHTAGQLNVNNWYAQRPEKRLDFGTDVDTTPVYKSFTVVANSFEITEPDAFYIYALFPIDKTAITVSFYVSKQYWREKMFNGFICVLVGVLNSEADERALVLDWARSGKDAKNVEFGVVEGNFVWRYVGENWTVLFPVPQDGNPGEQGQPGADGVTPHIGENGNWFIGATDTGIAAQGPPGGKGDPGDPGADGITPHIGPNGNWFVGAVDTGIAAQGPPGAKGDPGNPGAKGDTGDPGADGTTPHIGENGNWFIGVTDTGIPATGPQGPPGTGGDGGGGIDEIIEVYVDFTDSIPFTYTCPIAMRFLEIEFEGNAPALSVPLNTPLNQYDDVIITPDGPGLVILKGKAAYFFDWDVYIDFEKVEAETYKCPYALKFTSMEHEQANAPVLSVALNTDMVKYQVLTITPDALGLVTLKGILL